MSARSCAFCSACAFDSERGTSSCMRPLSLWLLWYAAISQQQVFVAIEVHLGLSEEPGTDVGVWGMVSVSNTTPCRR